MSNRPSKPTVIFFDAVGTLFGVKGTVGEIYGQIAGLYGVEVKANALDWAFSQVFREMGSPAFPDAERDAIGQLEFNWWRQVTMDTFSRADALMQFEDFDPFFAQLFAHFAGAEPWEIYPETIATLTTLQQSSIPLGVISNFDSRLYSVLDALSLTAFFTSVTISTEVGAAKPDRKIFDVALQKHQTIPARAWHVGDSLSEDYRAARAAGLRGVWIDR
jgi:putative hydrolase of the HAD superfamily